MSMSTRNRTLRSGSSNTANNSGVLGILPRQPLNLNPATNVLGSQSGRRLNTRKRTAPDSQTDDSENKPKTRSGRKPKIHIPLSPGAKENDEDNTIPIEVPTTPEPDSEPEPDVRKRPIATRRRSPRTLTHSQTEAPTSVEEVNGGPQHSSTGPAKKRLKLKVREPEPVPERSNVTVTVPDSEVEVELEDIGSQFESVEQEHEETESEIDEPPTKSRPGPASSKRSRLRIPEPESETEEESQPEPVAVVKKPTPKSRAHPGPASRTRTEELIVVQSESDEEEDQDETLTLAQKSKSRARPVPVSGPASKRRKLRVFDSESESENEEDKSQFTSPSISQSQTSAAFASSSRTKRGIFPKPPLPAKNGSSQYADDHNRRPVLMGELAAEQEKRLALPPELQASGIIKTIRLFNFMCHEKFEMKWHNNLNFITGENGSGKSALLSGLLVGLGARALSTSRTKSIKSLIQNGKEYAKTEIVLINNGELNEAKYGSEIMIQRTIDSRGSSSYKIQDGLTATRMRPLKREELDHILRACSIMLENPVTILNQETARSFLKTKDPKDKYNLFYKGTNLEASTDYLTKARKNIEIGSQNLKKTKDVLVERKAEVRNYEKEKQKFDELDKMDEKITELNIVYHWSIVGVDERKHSEMVENLNQIEVRMTKLEEKLKDLADGKKALEEESDGTPAEKAALQTQLRDLGRSQQEITKKLSIINNSLTLAKSTFRQSTAREAQLTKSIGILENKIEDLSTRGAAEAEQARREYEERKEVLLAELEQATQIFTSLNDDLNQFRHGADTLKDELNQLEDQAREVKNRKFRAQEELRSLAENNSGRNKYAAFGKPMEDLMALIQANSHRFRRPPHGPLGACIKAKSEKWVRLVEFVLKDKLIDFVVGCEEDVALLNNLIKQSYLRGPTIGPNERRRPTVLLVPNYRTQLYDVSRFYARTPNHPTVFDVIEPVDNDFVVINAFIDTLQIERILLFESRLAGTELLKNSRGPNFPQTCLSGYTHDGFKVSPDPRFRVDPNAQWGRFRGGVIKCTKTSQIRILKEQIIEIEEEYKSIVPELDEKRKAESAYRSTYQEKYRAVQEIRSKVRDIKVQIDGLERQVGNIREPDIASFAEELADKKDELIRTISSKDENGTKIQDLKLQIPPLEQEKVEVIEQIDNLKIELADYDDRAAMKRGKIAEIDAVIIKMRPKYRTLERDAAKLKLEIAQVQEQLQKHTEEAEEYGEKVETNKTPDSIQRNVQAFSEQVRLARENIGDKNVILRKLERAKESFLELNKHYSATCTMYSLAKALSGLAEHQFEVLKQMLSNLVMSCFDALIGSRGYKGKLLLDHDLKELYYFIFPDAEAAEKITGDIRTKGSKALRSTLHEYASGLSGGERSFATICFIISLWQVMDSPFYMLDEFDVFMDAFNRKASQNALISHSLCHKTNQFFFFTPLELTEMPNQADAVVLRMYPPERNDSTISASRVEVVDDDNEDDEDESPRPGTSRSRGTRRALASAPSGRRGRK